MTDTMNPAAVEPDEPRRGASPHPTSKDAVWKSVLGATGGFGCERATLYRETIRDPATGYRMQFGMPERVIFGTAVDAAHEYLMSDRLTNGPSDVSFLGVDLSEDGTGEPLLIEHLEELSTAATRRGVEKARGQRLLERWSPEAWTVFTERVGLAVEKLIGLWPNRVKEGRDGPLPEPEGTPPGPPIGWLDPAPGIMTFAQRRLELPDVVGGRGVVGKPDYIFARGDTIIAWVDVKAKSKSGSYPQLWRAAEAITYDAMCTYENGGILPEWHGYLEYRRGTGEPLAKPYWALVTAPVSTSITDLFDGYSARWANALDVGDPDNVSFNLWSCRDCEWREAIDAGGRRVHGGCAIGQAAMDIGADEPEDADVG